MRFLIAFSLILSCFSVDALTTKVLWLQADVAPCHITSGANSDTGFCDKTFNKIIAPLTQFQHQKRPVNLGRYLELMKKDGDVCASEILPTEERKQYLIFSEPYIAVLPNGVMTRYQDARFKPFVNAKGEIQLDKLVSETTLIPGLYKNRVYKGIIDQILATVRSSPHMGWLEGSSQPSVLLQRGRFDYTIHYPASVLYLNAQTSDMKPITWYPIAGTEPLLKMHYSCTKTPLGERVIRQVNRQLKDVSQADIAAFYAEWLNDEARSYYLKLVSERNYW